MRARWKKPIRRGPLPCDRKKSYSTYEEAVRVAIILVENDAASVLTAYRCSDPRCRRFHLSHKVSHDGRFPAFEGKVADETPGAE